MLLIQTKPDKNVLLLQVAYLLGMGKQVVCCSQECTVVSPINALMQQSISAKQIKRRRNLFMGTAQWAFLSKGFKYLALSCLLNWSPLKCLCSCRDVNVEQSWAWLGEVWGPVHWSIVVLHYTSLLTVQLWGRQAHGGKEAQASQRLCFCYESAPRESILIY